MAHSDGVLLCRTVCALCLLIPGSPGCLRKQARRYLHLSKKVFSQGVHDALQELSEQLMDEASALENDGATYAAGNYAAAVGKF